LFTLPSPAVRATASQAQLNFRRLISSAPQMHLFQFYVALPAISFLFHRRVSGLFVFLSARLVLVASALFGFIQLGRFH